MFSNPQGGQSEQGKNMVIVDAHVHIYDCFELGAFFDAAYRNFLETARRHGADSRFHAVLMLTETGRDHWFQRLIAQAGGSNPETALDTASWRLHPLPEPGSLLARRTTEEAVFLLAGRQIITAEGLEVLALATERQFADGRSLEETLQEIRAQDALPVIPWAAGKWLGRRGKILSGMLRAGTDAELYLGDNSGRPVFWRRPAHFRMARAAGLRILPGSDPLPLTSGLSRVGSFGFLARTGITGAHPAADIKQMLRSDTEITPYGRLEGPLRFFSNQLRLRMTRRAA
jgi:hypothetical protein